MRFLLILSLITVGACSSKKPDKKPVVYPDESPEVSTTIPQKPSISAKQVASQMGSHLVTEFKFTKGTYNLTSANKQKIKELYQKADRKGQIDEVQLITWADREFPTEQRGELADVQQELVDERNKSIEKYLNELDKDLDVNKISMAERAGALDRFIASDEAKVKETMDTKDAPDKVSKSIIIFVMEKSKY